MDSRPLAYRCVPPAPLITLRVCVYTCPKFLSLILGFLFFLLDSKDLPTQKCPGPLCLLGEPPGPCPQPPTTETATMKGVTHYGLLWAGKMRTLRSSWWPVAATDLQTGALSGSDWGSPQDQRGEDREQKPWAGNQVPVADNSWVLCPPWTSESACLVAPACSPPLQLPHSTATPNPPRREL